MTFRTTAHTLDEQVQLQLLHTDVLIDPATDEIYADLARLTAQICDAPVALISIVDNHRRWFKAVIGLSVTESLQET